jgi:tRNA dimethylallyltransferase
MDLKSKIILIYGPTASGKSEFSIKLAKKIKGEIVNADSMQVYKELKILSARPLKKDFKKIKHHLYGFRNSRENFSTGDWLKIIVKKIKDIKKRKKIPILVGGTGLYFKALTEGLVEIPSIPLRFRNQVRALQKSIGQEKFYKKLLKIDPSAINQVKPQDTQRTLRAYEVKLFTKKSVTEWYKNTKSKFKKKDFFKLYINLSRPKLIEKINIRTELMLKNGVIQEVKKFTKFKISRDKSITKAIGLTEIKDLIKNKASKEEVIEKISIKTRQYAKRQVTWARGHMSDWKKVKHEQLGRFLKKI